jgi:hypothetical protein
MGRCYVARPARQGGLQKQIILTSQQSLYRNKESQNQPSTGSFTHALWVRRCGLSESVCFVSAILDDLLSFGTGKASLGRIDGKASLGLLWQGKPWTPFGIRIRRLAVK